MESGVATRPIVDLEAYGRRLQQFVYHSGTLMQPVFAAARKVPPERAGSSMPKARMSGCCARCKSRSMKGWSTPILVAVRQ